MGNSSYNLIKITERIKEQIDIQKKKGNKTVTKEHLAEALHSNRRTISDYLNTDYLKQRINSGCDETQIKHFTLPQLIKLSEILECDLGFLLGEYEEHNRTNYELCSCLKLSEDAINNINNLDEISKKWNIDLKTLLSDLLKQKKLPDFLIQLDKYVSFKRIKLVWKFKDPSKYELDNNMWLFHMQQEFINFIKNWEEYNGEFTRTSK